jgi:ankyrin repeat protein
MLDLGANVDQMDNSGLYALKYALIRRDNPGLQLLLDRGATIGKVDNKKRNLLHHAVNMSSATADATFETEQFLIDKGVELNG